MASTESLDDLEQKVSGRLEESLLEIRRELEEQLQSARERLEGLVSSELSTARQEAAQATEALAAAETAREAADAMAAEAVAAKEAAVSELTAAAETARAAEEEARRELEVALEAARAAEEKVATAPREILERLREATAAIDRGRTQAEVLHALMSRACDFTSRTALFLTREDGLQGWGCHGFDVSEDTLQEVRVGYGEDTGCVRLVAGQGVIELDSGESAALCEAIDGSSPQEAVLVPLILRDRLAAVLYADRLDPDHRLEPLAIQLLAYLAALALETLPLRERVATATLQMAAEPAIDLPPLDFWQFAGPAAQAEPALEEVEQAVEVEAEPAPAPEPADEAVGEPVIEAETIFQPVPIEEPELAEEEAWEESEPIELQPAEESGFAMEAAVAEEEVVETLEAEPPEPEDSIVAAFEDEPEPFAATEPVVSDDLLAAAPPEVTPSYDEMPTEEAAEEPALTATEMAAEPIPPPTRIAPPRTAVVTGAEVAPPEDLEGPGWAFTTRRFEVDAGGDAVHEEARRLARLLVTEIKLYNEEQVEEGRRNRNIYQILREDIDRSRQIYEERIDENVRDSSDYFRDELVRILAGGDIELLGM